MARRDAAARRDRAIGALVGLAVGDAVGTTLEFAPPGSFEPIDDMVGGGPFGLEPGQWTDDTSMAMCLAESILDTGDHDPADQLRRYSAWWRDGYWSSNGHCFDIGGTTARALRRFEADGSITPTVVDQAQAANGSLMRLSPVPIRWHTDLAEAAHRSGESSRTTHPTDRPVDACRVLGAMTAALIQGVDPRDVFDPGFWDLGPLDRQVEAVARGSWCEQTIRGTGYVVDALEAALWSVAGAADFREAVLRAANLGDDADTTAAIAGQLAGARWGWSNIPSEWRKKISEADRIAAIAGRLHDVAAGVVPGERTRWDHDELVHAYWVEPGTILAGEYPGSPTVGTATRKINLLVDHGVRTFVDLTTPEDHLEPYERILDEVARLRALDLKRINHPIPDNATIDAAGYDTVIATIRSAARRGSVYVHCWGGIGRTGTVIGCLLVDDGLDAQEALDRLANLRRGTRKARREAPETGPQRNVIRERADDPCG